MSVLSVVILVLILLWSTWYRYIKHPERYQGYTTKTVRKRAYGPERLFTPFGSRYYLVHKQVPKKGWWRASDGNLYPPHLHPNYKPPPPPPPPPKRK